MSALTGPSAFQGKSFKIGTDLMKQVEEVVTQDVGSKFNFSGYEVGVSKSL